MRLIVPLLLLVVLVVVAVVVLENRRRTQETRRLFALVDRVRDLAWDHDPLDPKLCGAVLDRIRAVDQRPSRDEARRALDDILQLARENRETSPDLSVILIDTIRSSDRPEIP